GEGLYLSLAPEFDRGRLAGVFAANLALHVPARINRRAVDSGDHVAYLQAGFVRRAAGLDARDHGALARLDVEMIEQVGGQLDQLDAQVPFAERQESRAIVRVADAYDLAVAL